MFFLKSVGCVGKNRKKKSLGEKCLFFFIVFRLKVPFIHASENTAVYGVKFRTLRWKVPMSMTESAALLKVMFCWFPYRCTDWKCRVAEFRKQDCWCAGRIFGGNTEMTSRYLLRFLYPLYFDGWKSKRGFLVASLIKKITNRCFFSDFLSNFAE